MTDSVRTRHPAHDLVGKVLMSYEMPIEWGKIREFARATGSTQPAYDEPDAVIPPTFLTTSALWEPTEGPTLVERLGVDLTRVLQGGQEYVFPRGYPRAGEQLFVEIGVESVTVKEGKRGGAMTFIVVLTTYRRGGAQGEIAAEGRATVIERSS